ncbi:hypothetical protein NPIL_657041 [Nephila pilipes]|uniref:Uncharacterized protein n=1 Tax=Nephila pilipes TaxID=299642 RepID=A0A8X6MZL4_NEPPI|nr:hypothetical protein NPIL_657041 [Nephila pilipes]
MHPAPLQKSPDIADRRGAIGAMASLIYLIHCSLSHPSMLGVSRFNNDSLEQSLDSCVLLSHLINRYTLDTRKSHNSRISGNIVEWWYYSEANIKRLSNGDI